MKGIIEINIEDKFRVKPNRIYKSKITKSGNGAVARALKKHIGKECILIVLDEDYEEIRYSAGSEGWVKTKDAS